MRPPPPTSAASHHDRTRLAGVAGAALAPGTAGQEGLSEAGWDGWWLAETSEWGPDVTSGTSTPIWRFGWGLGAASPLAERPRVCAGRLAHPPPSLEDFCPWVGKIATVFPCERGRGRGRSRAGGGVASRAGIPASLTAASEPLPRASRPPQGFPPPGENNRSNKCKTWERPECFLFTAKNLGAAGLRRGRALPALPPAGGRCCRCRGGPGVRQGTVRGAHRGGMAGEGLGTGSVLAARCVRDTQTRLPAPMDSWTGSLRGDRACL